MDQQDKYLKRQLILDALGSARILPYSSLSNGTTKSTLALYFWNIEVSAAFYELIALLEVVVRNSFHRGISEWCTQQGVGGDWLITTQQLPHPLAKLFDSQRLGAISAAKSAKKIRDKQKGHPRSGSPIDENDVLSQISFGKWHHLVPFHASESHDSITNGYRKVLWESALANVFSAGIDPDEVRWALFRLTHFRNRIAHHECIIAQSLRYSPRQRNPLQQRLSDIFFIAKSLDENVWEEMTAHNKVSNILKNCPVTTAANQKS